MSIDKINIHVIDPSVSDDEDPTAILSFDEDRDQCVLELSYKQHVYNAISSDYFESLVQIRKQLEKIGVIPFCYGASLSVYPSGMARDMGQGLRAYRLKMGVHSSTNDLVDIFSEGPDVIPAFPHLQVEYFNNWLRSIQK
jgi:hypothetical protein